MNDDGIDSIVTTCAQATTGAGHDRTVVDALVRCAEAIATEDVDCPLGALVVDVDAASWSRAAAALVEQGVRAVDPVFLASIRHCSAHARLGNGCPLTT